MPVDITEKMGKLREALMAARTNMSTQQQRLTQMTTELARVKQSRISTDLTGELHSIVLVTQFTSCSFRSTCNYRKYSTSL